MSEVIALHSLTIEPNNCPFSDPVVISLQFDSKGVTNATWKVHYEADVTSKRHIIELCQQGPIDYEAGSHNVDLKIPPVNTEGVKTRYLMTMGILKCGLFSGDEEVSSINIVTQV